MPARLGTYSKVESALRRSWRRRWKQQLTSNRSQSRRGSGSSSRFRGWATKAAPSSSSDHHVNITRAFCDFRRMPATKIGATSLLESLLKGAQEGMRFIAETFNIETLDDSGETSAENNSSVILLVTVGESRLLFTGDAGIPALTAAVDFANSRGIDLATLAFLQVPHHGSKRNIGPTILSRILAPTAFISASRNGSPKHPAKKVVNALIRRNAKVYATQGKGLCHPRCVVPRPGWSSAQALPFYDQVEE